MGEKHSNPNYQERLGAAFRTPECDAHRENKGDFMDGKRRRRNGLDLERRPERCCDSVIRPGNRSPAWLQLAASACGLRFPPRSFGGGANARSSSCARTLAE